MSDIIADFVTQHTLEFMAQHAINVHFRDVISQSYHDKPDSFSDHDNVIDFVLHRYSDDELREIGYYLEDLISTVLSGSGITYTVNSEYDIVKTMFDILWPSLMLDTNNGFKIAQSLVYEDNSDRFLNNLSDSQFDFSECLEKDTSALIEGSVCPLGESNESIIYDKAVTMTFEYDKDFMASIPERRSGIPYTSKSSSYVYEYHLDGR